MTMKTAYSTRTLIIVCLLCLGFVPIANAQTIASPADLTDTTKLWNDLQHKDIRFAGNEYLYQYVNLRLVNTARAHGIQLNDVAKEDLKRLSRVTLERLLRSFSSQESSSGKNHEQDSKRFETLRYITTQRNYENLLAAWLGVPTVGRIGKQKRPHLANSKTPLNASLSGSNSWRLNSQNTQLLADEGDEGHNNQVVDAGEWAHLSFNLVNNSKNAFYSSMGTWKRGIIDQCAWTTSLHYDPLPEVQPGQGFKFKSWVYFSKNCRAQSKPGFILTIKDTHRGTHRLSINVNVRPAVNNKTALSLILDKDRPGFSKTSTERIVQPGTKMELSLKVKNKSQAKQIRAYSAVPSDLKPLFRVIVPAKDIAFLNLQNGHFEPQDDTDMEVLEKYKYEKKLSGFSQSKRWFPSTTASGTLWLANDILVVHGGPGAGSSKKSNVSNAKTQETEAKLSANQVIELVTRNLRFESRKVTAKNPNAIGAVAGHDVIFDRDGFLNEYSTLSAVSLLGDLANHDGTRSYIVRRYTPLLMANLTPKPQPKPKPKPRVRRVVKRQPEPEPEVDLPASIRFDLGIGAAFYKHNQPSGFYYWDDTESTFTNFNLRASYGATIVGVAGLSYGFSSPKIGNGDELSAGDLLLSLGVGANFGPKNKFEFQPRIAIAYNHRKLDGVGSMLDGSPGIKTWEDSNGFFGLELGATIRGFVSNSFGVFLDLSYVIAGDGPFVKPVDSAEIGVLNGSTFRIGSGISF